MRTIAAVSLDRPRQFGYDSESFQQHVLAGTKDWPAMRSQQQRQLIETIYDAAVDPAAWPSVMEMLKQSFATTAETFYFLDFADNSMRSVHVGGIADRYVRCFADRYFTPDNPWIRAKPLHKPGVVRTDARLAQFFRDPLILRRSEYYNDWMRPQD